MLIIFFVFLSENTSNNAETKLEGLKEPVRSIVAVADRETTVASVNGVTTIIKNLQNNQATFISPCMWVSTQRAEGRTMVET